MKRLSIGLFLFLLFSCQQEKSFLGKWRLVAIDYSEHLETLEGEEKTFFESILEKQSVMLDQTFYDFKGGNELHVITPKKVGSGQIMQIEKWGSTKNLDSLYFINEEMEIFRVDWSKRDTLQLFATDYPKRKLVLVKE
ncbi:MAG: hypothetical protein WC044_02210 [Crocinitomicaceae bacterium]